MNTSTVDVVTFAGFELALDTGRLLENGSHVKLRPKSSAVLACLGRRANQLVSKRELMQAVWGDAEVSEGALTQSIIDIRRGLGEHRGLLRTVPRRGYVLEIPSAQEPHPHKRFHRSKSIAAALVVAVVLLGIAAVGPHLNPTEPIKPLALLVAPFSDLSSEQNLAHLGFGIADEVGNLLDGHMDIRVVRPPAPDVEKSQLRPLARAAQASHILQGSVAGSFRQSLVNVSLIDVESGVQRWSKSFDVKIDDWLTLQRQISIAVAASLNTEIALNDWRSADDLQAWEHYQRGKFYFHRRGDGDLAQAQQAFDLAIEKDANYANAWLGMLAMESVRGKGPTDRSVRTAMERVIALAPERADTHMRLADIYLNSDSETLAMSHFSRALALQPDHPHVLSWMAARAYAAGDHDTGRNYMLRAAKSDPLNPIVQINVFASLLGELRFEQANAQLNHLRLLERYSPVSPTILEARLKLASGTLTLEDEKRLEQIPLAGRSQLLVLARAARGDRSPMSSIAEGDELAGVGESTSVQLLEAETQALLGERDLAIETIRTMLDEQPSEHRHFYLYLANISPFLAHLRNDPKWPTVDNGLTDGFVFNNQRLR